MRRYTIRRKLLLLTLIPPLVLLLVILGHFLYQDHRLMKDMLLDRGDAVSRYLASAAEYGVITGNTEQLHRISDSVLRNDIVALAVYDFDQRELFRRGEEAEGLERSGTPYDRGHCGGKGEYLVFCAPIQLVTMAVSDYEQSDAEVQSSLIGHVELVLSTRLLAGERAVMLRWSMVLLLAVVMGALWLSRRVERQLVEPLSSLSHGVERVRGGDMAMRVSEDASGELLVLQQGVNAMVEALAGSRHLMEQEVEHATRSLRNTMEELEQRNEQLRVERQRAENASLAKSQFLATMSHEIRTPLSGMIGMLQLLRDNSTNRHQLDCIDGLERSAQSLRQLIDDILDFSRMEVGKLAIQNKAFSPLAVIEEVMVMLAPSAHHKGLEFVLDVEGNPPDAVCGDPLRFRQVLINLTANAIKFTDEGEVVVAARLLEAPQPEWCRLRLEVSDSGIGIPEEKQGLVFDSFTQVDDGDARSYGGSGLGTTVSRELVELMGGSIGLQSDSGKGSCFWFELPWQLGEAQPLAHPVNSARVLLLEQHEIAAAAVQRMLKRFGLSVQRVSTEEGVWTALAEGSFDWILAGENSSESDHREMLEKLAAGPMTHGYLCQLSTVNGIQAEGGSIKHLSKPVLPSQLQQLFQTGQVCNEKGEMTDNTRALSVLLAEDDEINATVITHFLAKGGHQVVRVEDGEAALVQLQQGGFDCVLMDMRMPGLDGLEATRRWRSRESEFTARLPIIALTANASAEDRQRCVDAGMDDFLTKPVDRKELLGTLARYCP